MGVTVRTRQDALYVSRILVPLFILHRVLAGRQRSERHQHTLSSAVCVLTEFCRLCPCRPSLETPYGRPGPATQLTGHLAGLFALRK
ncbi:hypothetical protein V1506DRAFT_531103 [Lipomyces tetrasporus]